MILRARTILPITAPPIENGAIVVSGNQICAAGKWPEIKSNFPGEKKNDLGEVVLLPGLVNAHCHLDYTDMAGRWSPPKTFLDWIPQMLAAKAAWSYTDYARSWLNGAKMLLQTGTTTVADIEAVPELLPEMWDATPLRVFSFLEMTGVRSKRQPKEILDDALEKMDSLSHSRSHIGLSPHAPYSTSPELLKLCATAAREKKIRITTHVAESEQEFEMFAHARGEMFGWLLRNGRSMSDCGRSSPVQHLEHAGLLGENFLAVHANYLSEVDFDLLAKRNASVVHCPRSHDYFRHREFPLEKLLAAGINVCLGTDSLATVRKTENHLPKLDMFAEMRALAAKNKTISAKEILQMATVNSAQALGFAGKIGEISKNTYADLITVPFVGRTDDVYDSIVRQATIVSAGMIDGHWIIPPP